MPQYRVSWTADLDADSAEAAARLALDIQRDPSSIATVFAVTRKYESGRLGEPQHVDLTELNTNRSPQPRKPADYQLVVAGEPGLRFSARAAALDYAKRHLTGRAVTVFYSPLNLEAIR